MTTHNLASVLKVIRNLIMSSRPCYRDYLGTETVTTQICHGIVPGSLPTDDIELTCDDTSFTGFVLGETYQATINGETTDCAAIGDEHGAWIGTYQFNEATNTESGWQVWGEDGEIWFFAVDGIPANATISISQTKTAKRYNTRLLPEYLLPTFLRKDVVATKTEVQSATNEAVKIARDAQSAASNVGLRITRLRYSDLNDLPFAYMEIQSADLYTTPTTVGHLTYTGAAADVSRIGFPNASDGKIYRCSLSYANYSNIVLYLPYSSIESASGVAGAKGFYIGTLNFSDIGSIKFSNVFIRIDGTSARLTMTVAGNVVQTGAGVYYSLTATLTQITYTQIPDIFVPDTIQRVGDDVILPSATPDSTKRFKLTVDDTGALTATEVTS